MDKCEQKKKENLMDLLQLTYFQIVSLKPEDTLRELTNSFCRQAGFTPTVVFEGDEIETIRDLIGAGRPGTAGHTRLERQRLTVGCKD